MRSFGNFLTILILALCFLATAGFLYLVSQDVEFTRKQALPAATSDQVSTQFIGDVPLSFAGVA